MSVAATSPIDWNTILLALVAGIPATVAAVGTIITSIYAVRNHRNIRTPSGDTLGSIAERTHHLAEVNAVRSARIDKAVNGDTPTDDEPKAAG